MINIINYMEHELCILTFCKLVYKEIEDDLN